MYQVLRGPLTVLGRLLLCTIFFMAAAGGKTPEATPSTALGTEFNKKDQASRFARPEPGKFTLRTK